MGGGGVYLLFHLSFFSHFSFFYFLFLYFLFLKLFDSGLVVCIY